MIPCQGINLSVLIPSQPEPLPYGGRQWLLCANSIHHVWSGPSGCCQWQLVSPSAALQTLVAVSCANFHSHFEVTWSQSPQQILWERYTCITIIAGLGASAQHACSQVADVALVVWQNLKPWSWYPWLRMTIVQSWNQLLGIDGSLKSIRWLSSSGCPQTALPYRWSARARRVETGLAAGW